MHEILAEALGFKHPPCWRGSLGPAAVPSLAWAAAGGWHTRVRSLSVESHLPWADSGPVIRESAALVFATVILKLSLAIWSRGTVNLILLKCERKYVLTVVRVVK